MLHIEVGIHVHYGVVAHFLYVLHAELSQGRIEHRCVILGEQAHIHTYLHIEGFHPCAVIVEVVVQCQCGQWDILRRAVLIHDVIIQVHPRGGDIQLQVSRQHLYISRMLLGQTLVIKVDMVGDVLKRHFQSRLHPLGRVGHLAAHVEAVGLAELVVPSVVVAEVVLYVVVGCLVLDIGLGGKGHRVFAQLESCVEMTVHLKLAQLVAHQADVSVKAVVDKSSTVLVEGRTDIGVVGPAVTV